MGKIKIEDVRKEIEAQGWELISSKYTNLKTDLQVQCPEGHSCFVSYDKLRTKHYECPICKQNQFHKKDDNLIKKQKETFRVLAFDQATITSGWSVYDNQVLVKYGHWTSKKQSSIEKVCDTKQWIASMIDKWQPDFITIEDIQLQRANGERENVLVFKKLAWLQGVLMNYFREIGMEYDVVPSVTWKSYNEVKGKTRTDQKKNAQLKVKRFFDISVTQDEADAILIGRYAANQHSSAKIITF